MAETDEEQLDELKAWWDENGNSLIIGVGLALIAVFGYRAWQNSVTETAEAASGMYEDLAGSLENIPPDGLPNEVLASVRSLGDQLKAEHGGSAYAHFGALYMAKVAVDKKEYDVAETELRWVLDNDVDESLEVITRMRLARVLAAQGRVDEALLALESEADPGEHLSSVEEVRGDLYYQLGRKSDAWEAYQNAVDAVGEGRAKPFLKMKLEDLVDTTPKEASGE